MNRPAVMALMTLSLAAGFGVSFLRHDHHAELEATTLPPLATKSRAARVSPSEKLWLGTEMMDVSQMKTRLLEACSSGTWTEELEKGAVLVLIAEPSFINTLYRHTDPNAMDGVLDRILDRMADDCATSLLPIIDHADFDLSLPQGDWQWKLRNASRHDPLKTFETLRRNRRKFTYYPQAVLGEYAQFPDSARAMLLDAAKNQGESLYRDFELRTAASVVQRQDGSLPPGVSQLPAIQWMFQEKDTSKRVAAWKKGEGELPTERTDNAHNAPSSNFLYWSTYHRGKSLTASQFSELMERDRVQEAGRYLVALIETGRTNEAFEHFKSWVPTEESDFSKGTIAGTIATSIHKTGGDVGEAIRQLGDLSDTRYDQGFMEARAKLLTNWAEADPSAAREYLATVTDPELHEKLRLTIESTSLEP